MFKTRKAPKKLVNDEAEDESPTGNSDFTTKKPRASKVKKPSNLRATFGADDEDEEEDGGISAVKRIGSSRPAGGSGKPKTSRIAAERLPLREIERDIDRPSYSADHLAELKSSTPTKRPSPEPQEGNGSASNSLEISAKFGAGALIRAEEPSVIPSEAEIREKKERRRRLAREQDYISLNDEGNEDALDSEDEEKPGSRSLIHPAEEIDIKDKYGETRLVRDDEDFAEGFDEFVDDPGRVTLSRAGTKEQNRQRRLEMDAQIRAAQGGPSDLGEEDGENEIDEEEAARNAAYDEAQARFGTYGTRNSAARSKEKAREASLQKRLQNVPEMGALPDWKSVMVRFDELMRKKNQALEISRHRLEEIRREREEIDVEQTRVQGLLKEAGDKFEQAQREMASEGKNITPADETQQNMSTLTQQGFEGINTTGEVTRPTEESLDMLRPATLSGMAGMPHSNATNDDEDDDDYY